MFRHRNGQRRFPVIIPTTTILPEDVRCVIAQVSIAEGASCCIIYPFTAKDMEKQGMIEEENA